MGKRVDGIIKELAWLDAQRKTTIKNHGNIWTFMGDSYKGFIVAVGTQEEKPILDKMVVLREKLYSYRKLEIDRITKLQTEATNALCTLYGDYEASTYLQSQETVNLREASIKAGSVVNDLMLLADEILYHRNGDF